LKWFGQDIIRANSARLRFVERLKRAHEQHYRNMFQLFVCFDISAHFIAVGRGHENVCENYVGFKLQELINRVLAIANRHDSHTFVSERKVDNFLNGGRIVGE
jgi:hypothetical protein